MKTTLRSILSLVCAATLMLPVSTIKAQTPDLTISEVRAGNAGTAKAVAVIEDARSGLFRYDSTDTTTADDGALTLVGAGKRYKRIADVITPQMFGAKGDGTTDDTAAITAAISAANTQKKALYFPVPAGGFYKITDKLTLTSGLRVYGEGYRSAIKQVTQGRNVFEAASNTTIEGLRLIGDDGNTATDLLASNGVLIIGATTVTVRDCYMSNFQSCGILVRDSNLVSLSGNFIFGNRWPGGISNGSDILCNNTVKTSGLLIKDNFCLSNNSQGIYISSGVATDNVIISDNICITHNADLTQTVQASVLRRYGIRVGFTGGVEFAATVSGNICTNTNFSGIYTLSNGSPSGKLVISNNQVIDTGYTPGSALSGGIHISQTGGMVDCHDNMIRRFRGDQSGAIKYAGEYSADYVRASIHHNYIEDPVKYGVFMIGWIRNVTVQSNRIVNPGDAAITATGTAAYTGQGGLRILENEILRGNALAHAIMLDVDNYTLRNEVHKNYIHGFDKTVNSTANTGIYIKKNNASVTGNLVSNFRHGIYFEPILSTNGLQDVVCDRNEIENCENGIVTRFSNSSLAPYVICQGTVFRNVTAKFSGGGSFSAGYDGRKFGNGNMEFHAAAIPTKGAFLAQDKLYYSNPLPGGWIGAVCVTSGSPGVWKQYGAVEP